MAKSIYQHPRSGIYYICVRFKGRKICRSLGTKDKKSAKNIAIDYEVEIIKEILGFKKPKEPVLFSKLYTLYISADHEWSRNTYLLNELALRKYDKTRTFA